MVFKKKQRKFICSGSIDHVESLQNNIVVSIVTTHDIRPKQYDKIQYFVELANFYGLSLEYLDFTPEPILNEKKHWLRFSHNKFHWFSLHTKCNDALRIFAMLYYCALAIKKAIGHPMKSILLAGCVETQPNGTIPFQLTDEEMCIRKAKQLQAIREYHLSSDTLLRQDKLAGKGEEM